MSNKEKSALELAKYIYDSQNEFEDFKDFIKEGNNPENHIYYHACVILELEDYLESE